MTSLLSTCTKDQVIPGLYMGGGWLTKDVLANFDVLVLCAEDVAPPDEELAGIEVHRCWLWDAKPTDAERTSAFGAGHRVANCVREGRRVLVTCLGGLNRSGLVVGLALLALGKTADEAIALVRMARGIHALSNEHFVKMIQEYGQAKEGGRR